MRTNAETALQTFAKTGDHSAFAEVVECLGGLVFSSAMRRTGNREIAQEVTQNVFAILARKAKRVAKHPSLEGWIYTTTRLESATASRKRQQHQRKVDAVRAQLQTGTDMNDTDMEAWRDAIPHLHESLDRLADTEREILLARFFAGNSFAEISERFGKSEAACKMRVKRSLEKLKTWMSKRGATLSVSTLATGLSTEWSEAAAPTSITPTLSANALAAAPGIAGSALLTNAILTMKTTKLSAIIAAGILAAGSTPSIIQYAHGNSLRKQIDDYPTAGGDVAAVPQPSDSEASGQMIKSTPATRFLKRPFIINDVETFIDRAAVAKVRNDLLELTGVYAAIAKLSDAELEKLIGDVAASKKSAGKRRIAQALLIQLASLRENVKTPVFNQAIATSRSIRGLEKAIGRFARDHPQDALAWFYSQQEQGLLEGTGTETSLTAEVVEALLGGFAQSAPEEVLELVKHVPTDKDRYTVEAHAISELLQAGGESRTMALDHLAAMSDIGERGGLAGLGVSYAATRGATIDEAAEFIWEVEISNEQRSSVLGSIVRNQPKLSIAEQGNWLAEHVNRGAVDSMQSFIRRNLVKHPDEYREWVEALPRGVARDHAYLEEGRTLYRDDDFVTGIIRLDLVEDEALRTSQQERLLRSWSRENPEAARAAALQRNLPVK